MAIFLSVCKFFEIKNHPFKIICFFKILINVFWISSAYVVFQRSRITIDCNKFSIFLHSAFFFYVMKNIMRSIICHWVWYDGFFWWFKIDSLVTFKCIAIWLKICYVIKNSHWKHFASKKDVVIVNPITYNRKCAKFYECSEFGQDNKNFSLESGTSNNWCDFSNLNNDSFYQTKT